MDMTMDAKKAQLLAMTEYKTEAEIEDFLQENSSDPSYGALLSFLLSQGWDKFEETLRA